MVEIHLSTSDKRNNIVALADTGCQSCLATIGVVSSLGLKRTDLILSAAISGRNRFHKMLGTRQIVYVTDSSDNVFISRKACVV